MHLKLLKIWSGTPPIVGATLSIFTMGPERVTSLGVFKSWVDWVNFKLLESEIECTSEVAQREETRHTVREQVGLVC